MVAWKVNGVVVRMVLWSEWVVAKAGKVEVKGVALIHGWYKRLCDAIVEGVLLSSLGYAKIDWVPCWQCLSRPCPWPPSI